MCAQVKLYKNSRKSKKYPRKLLFYDIMCLDCWKPKYLFIKVIISNSKNFVLTGLSVKTARLQKLFDFPINFSLQPYLKSENFVVFISVSLNAESFQGWELCQNKVRIDYRISFIFPMVIKKDRKSIFVLFSHNIR